MIDNPVFENVTIKTSEPAEMCVTSSDGRVQFVGNYAPALLLGNSYGNIYMGPEDMLLIPEANMNYDAFQAYFRIDVGNGLGMPGPNYIRDCVMNIDGQFGNGDTTGIVTIDGDSKSLAHEFERDGWYTVDGRRLSGRPSAKGIYIHRSANGSAQGKKVAIK